MKATASCLLTGVLRTTTLAIVIASWITWAALPAVAQNTVPSSATQAAKMPQYASRLARPGSRPASQHKSSAGRHGLRTELLDDSIYDNGPINGTVDAFVINFGFVVSNTLTVSSSGSIAGMSFGAWLFPGDILETAEISITSSEFGGTTYFDHNVDFTASDCVTNPLGFSLCTETSSSFNTPALNSGTYWVNVQNAVVNNGDPVYWDENSGVGCTSPGCPSQASENSVGTIPSESFTMEGIPPPPPPPACYRSEGNLQILHSIPVPQQGSHPSPTGVVIDNAGSLYGTTIAGGSNHEGFAYKLAHFADWLFEPLFNFSGGDTGGPPTGAIIGPNGSLYGGAQGGIQNCGSDGSQYCGLVYNLMPTPNPCASARCGWNESVPYRFASESDGSGVINVSAHDQQGNLYGTTSSGGAHGAGTVFELMPSGGGWAKTTLYSFTGGDDGSSPAQVLQGNDGSLYGVAYGGLFGGGVVFQLTRSGGQWSERVLHAFGFEGGAGAPSNLVQDSAGNLYGTANSPEIFTFSPIFALSKTGSLWSYSEYAPEHYCQGGDIYISQLNNLTIDATGNVYGTGAGTMNVSRNLGTKTPGEYSCFYNFIYKARYDSEGWHYDDLWFSDNEYFQSSGSLAIDAIGNLYGTTTNCGTYYNGGTVWQLSP